MSTTYIFGCLLLLSSYAIARSNGDQFDQLLKLDSSFYRKGAAQMPFPVLPPPRTTRQSGGGPICVPSGTCIGGGTTGGGIIDPRIVTPGQVVTPAPSTCPAGQVLCNFNSNYANCGTRFTSSVSTADGTVTYGAYPWQAYIVNQTSYTGSGILVDQYNVITAAHKVNLNVNSPGNVRVYIGVGDPATTLSTAQMRNAISITLHPSFNPTTLMNDIAIIRLNSPIALGYQINVGTICLPAAGTSFVGQSCLVAGWGQTMFNANDAPTSPMKQVTVPIVNYQTCRTSLSASNLLGTNVDTYLDQNELCAGGQANRDACTQDGGAPLTCTDSTGRFTAAGLVIWGKNCGQANVYGVYVDLSKYRSWIDQTLSQLNAG